MEINKSALDLSSRIRPGSSSRPDPVKSTKKEARSQEKNIKTDAYSVNISQVSLKDAAVAANPSDLARSVKEDSLSALLAASSGLSEKSLELLK